VLSYVHNQLTVESTCALLCLGVWSKAGFINKEDIHAIAILPDVKDGKEELEDEFDAVI
jgi:hypothetical protein